jgi:hypothetical protein
MSTQLRNFFKDNETRIGEHYKTSLPVYYDSLRHGFDFFFRTFRSKNYYYQDYAFSTLHAFYEETNEEAKKREAAFVSREFTDDDNTLLSLISFQRFFELFSKSVLESIDERLALKLSNSHDFINMVVGNVDLKTGQRIEAGEALKRIEILFSSTDQSIEEHLPNLKNAREKYPFFSQRDHLETIRLLNEWRNRLLHGGNVFPNLRAFDYFISKRVAPLVNEILPTEKAFEESNAAFYLTTVTKIDLLKEIELLDFDLSKLNEFPLHEDTSYELVKLGHLKELGRANMKMNLFVRINHASFEYNYRDPLGRGVRFAEAEREHEHFVSIDKCPCCGKGSLVLYQETIDDFFRAGKKIHIQWTTCYTCTYHIRINAGDPFIFGLSEKRIFLEHKDKVE